MTRVRAGLVATLCVTAFAATLAAGCGGTQNDPEAAAPLIGPWRMESYRDGDQLKPLLPDSHVTCEFAADAVSGDAGIDTFAGTYRVVNNDLRLRDVQAGASEGLPELVAQQKAFLEDLDRTRHFSVADGRLTLTAANGDVLVTLLPGTAAELVGSWRCTAYDAGGASLTKPAEGAEFTAEFGEGGSVSGATVAGPFVGAYETADAPALRLADLEILSDSVAADAEEKAAQDFLAALGETASYELGNGTLSLKDGRGYVVAMFESAE
ncbi:MAG: META domain-containing protein [Actinobacteria bacterium]|nr:MAG: META domain-containing protein [Actinomycetota bacterium]